MVLKLLKVSSLPEWYKDNNVILFGYRVPNPSVFYCLKTILKLHNESGNIWTHLIGSLLFSVLFVHTFNCNTYKTFDANDKIYLGAFFVSIITCLSISTLFHTLQCHSERVFRLMAKLDYCGITILITSSIIVWLYYGFYYTITPRIAYISITVFLGIICITISLLNRFSNPEFQAFRGVLFILLGLSGIAPFTHYCRYSAVLASIPQQIVFKSLILLFLMASIYIFGAVIYIIKIPERLNPGFFDLWFNSHQIFHMFVIGAALTYFHSLALLMEARLNYTLTKMHFNSSLV